MGRLRYQLPCSPFLFAVQCRRHLQSFIHRSSAWRLLLLLQLRVVSPDTIRVLAATITLEILLDVGSLFDGVEQLKYAIVLAGLSHLLHCLWERKFGSINTLSTVNPSVFNNSELWKGDKPGRAPNRRTLASRRTTRAHRRWLFHPIYVEHKRETWATSLQ